MIKGVYNLGLKNVSIKEEFLPVVVVKVGKVHRGKNHESFCSDG